MMLQVERMTASTNTQLFAELFPASLELLRATFRKVVLSLLERTKCFA